MVFIHGGTGTGRHDWGHAAEHVARSHRAALIDLRGHGESHGALENVSLTRFTADIPIVLAALEIEQAVLVGFSAGAYAAFAFAASVPQAVAGIVAVGASTRPATTQAAKRVAAGPWPTSLIGLRHVAADGPGYWRRLRAVLVREWQLQGLSPEELARVACPVLVCQGEEDRVQPREEALRLAETLGDSRLELVQGAGHAVQLDQPERFVALLDSFLATRDASWAGR